MILLSFDIEEFDVPLEHGVDYPFDRQIAVSVEGTRIVLESLRKHQIRATFFCTANFALHAPEVIREIVEDGHEVASHGYYHSSFKTDDLKSSRECLEKLTGQTVEGFRMARMKEVDAEDTKSAGYLYNSSLNPTFIPGRYNNLDKPRTYYYDKGVLQIPSSVTPVFRFPLFWLSFHNLPLQFYQWMLCRCVDHDGYAAIYFHPWEFVDLKSYTKGMKLPCIMMRNTGDAMQSRLDTMLTFLKKKEYQFASYSDFRKKIQSDSRNDNNR